MLRNLMDLNMNTKLILISTQTVSVTTVYQNYRNQVSQKKYETEVVCGKKKSLKQLIEALF
jgi:hypothetical protein